MAGKAKTRRFSPAQLAAQQRFAAMAQNRARSRPQGGVSAHNNPDRGRPVHEANIIVPRSREIHVVLSTSSATAPGAAGAAGAAVTGDSLVTRNYRDPSIQAYWASRQTAGFGQLAFPTGHDTTRGYRAGVNGGSTDLLLPIGIQIPLTPQEIIAHTVSGSAVAGDVEQDSWLTTYRQDQGQRWLDWDHVRTSMREMTTIEASLTTAPGPNYSGTELINADSDLLIANRDYAVLGATARTRLHCAGIVGPDTGNDRIGVPLFSLHAHLSARFFPMVYGACPIINSGNRNSTNFFASTDENAGTFVITWYLALLK